MTELSTDEMMDHLATICDRAANLFISSPVPSSEDEVPLSPWAAERQTLVGELGTADPSTMVGEVTATYLSEAAHQVRAVGQLLRTRTVVASLDPLARAVLERAGRVRWILEPSVSPKERGARACLEFAVSLQHYRETLSRIGANEDSRKSFRDMNTALRGGLEAWFTVERQPDDPCDPGSRPTKDVARWTLEGQAFLGLSGGVQHALASPGTSIGQAAATYAGISGFSHPSILFAREHITIDAGKMTFTYTKEDLEKITGLTAFGFLDAVRYWAHYFGADPEALQGAIDLLQDEMSSFSVLGTHDTGQP